MSTEPLKLWEIYEELKKNFLYENDINSIYILLTLYDLEENISNICPKYMCTKNIKKKIRYILRDRLDRDIVSHNISLLIHEDISRLELCFYLEGYKYGFYNNKWVNILEKKAIEKYGVNKIYSQKYLFHFDNTDEIRSLKTSIGRSIDNKEKKERYIESLVFTFSNRVIKKKIRNLEKYLDKQLKIDFNPYSYNINDGYTKFEDEELDKIYFTIVNTAIKNIKKIYKDACWFALNDKVIKRYT